MSYCGVVEVKSLEDALGATCGRSAESQCSDCGAPLCSVHIEHCQLCSETFCPSCLTFHQSKHTKSAKSHQATESPKKKTAYSGTSPPGRGGVFACQIRQLWHVD
jgi:predicted sulfurtransferase